MFGPPRAGRSAVCGRGQESRGFGRKGQGEGRRLEGVQDVPLGEGIRSVFVFHLTLGWWCEGLGVLAAWELGFVPRPAEMARTCRPAPESFLARGQDLRGTSWDHLS